MMTSALATMLAEVADFNEPDPEPEYTVRICTKDPRDTFHFDCDPVHCIDAALEVLDSRNFRCYCGSDHNDW
jgi:hypothetical protein